MSAKVVLTGAAGKVAVSLEASGFERRGLKFVRSVPNGFVSFIELQVGRKSTTEQLVFVINFGVIVPSLLLGDEPAKPEYGACHWGGRVADKDGVEIWWPVRASDNVDQLAARVTTSIDQQVLPALAGKQREEDLIALWKAGRSPLLVDSQRLLFLGTLLYRAGRWPELQETRAELEGKARDPFSLRALARLKELEALT
jgi:hypothetical protein